MLRRIFLFLASLGGAAVGLLLWNKRGDLKAELERTRGERRSGAEGKPRVTGPRTAGGPEAAPPGAGTAEARTTPRGATSAPTLEAAEQRCVAVTNAGKRCTRAAEPGSDRCWQHADPS